MSSQISKVEESVSSKADKTVVDTHGSKIKVLEDQVKSLASDISKIKDRIQLVRSEKEEKTKRENNIIIRGVMEQEDTPDMDNVRAILTDIGCQNTQITAVSRLGPKKKPQPQRQTDSEPGSSNSEGNTLNTAQASQPTQQQGRTRPIRVVLQDTDSKKKILKSATKIRKSKETVLYNPKNVFLVPDQTKMEREQDVALRKQLRDTRSKNPEDHFIIRKGRIIKLPAPD